MATTAIWPVRGRLGKIVLYVENPDKTTDTLAEAKSGSDAQSLSDVINYAMATNKTVDAESDETQIQYVTGVNCTATGARDQMMLTKHQYNKDGGIVAYHGYQSFKPGEVTADLAHKLGVQLAKELWSDRFEIVVATHLDRGHLHNHFCVNSVSFADGKRFRDNKTTYGQMRAASDRICCEHGLSVINEPQHGNSKQYGEWRADDSGKLSWKEELRTDLNYAIQRSKTKEELTQQLNDMGYQYKWGKELSILAPGKERYLRPVRQLGGQYSTENILKVLQEQNRYGIIRKPRMRLSSDEQYFIRTKLKGKDPESLTTRYYHYGLLVSIFATHKSSNLSPFMRREVSQLHAIFRQIELLFKLLFDTIEQLLNFRAEVKAKVHPLYQERNRLYKQISRTDDQDEIAFLRGELKKVGIEYASVRTIVKDCNAIIEREPKVNEHIRQLQPRQRQRDSRER